MSEHTPGPWIIDSDDGDIIEVVSGDYFIADVHRLEPKDEWRANARLIAAAPELLEALEELVDLYEYEDNVSRDARAAIAKARGRDD